MASSDNVPTPVPRVCSSCSTPEASLSAPLKACARCHTALYCSRKCQSAHWKTHKGSCRDPNVPWYEGYRKCMDGAKHEGELELITWSGENGIGEAMGWGNILAEESNDLKRKFETEFGGDKKKMYQYWPQGFRWTCCGTQGDQHFGCDHHGEGSTRCTCDFCKMGKETPDSIHYDRINSIAGRGLILAKGPDPRSLDPVAGKTAEMMRGVLGLPE